MNGTAQRITVKIVKRQVVNVQDISPTFRINVLVSSYVCKPPRALGCSSSLSKFKTVASKDINIMSAARCRLTESSEVVKNRWKKRKKTKKFN